MPVIGSGVESQIVGMADGTNRRPCADSVVASDPRGLYIARMPLLRPKKSRPRSDVEHQIRHELADILPILRIDQCAIELGGFDPASGTATLVFKGGCPTCDCSPATFMQGIETQLKLRVAEIKAVIATDVTE